MIKNMLRWKKTEVKKVAVRKEDEIEKMKVREILNADLYVKYRVLYDRN